MRLERIECGRPKCLEECEQCEAVRACVYASIPAACFAVGATLGLADGVAVLAENNRSSSCCRRCRRQRHEGEGAQLDEGITQMGTLVQWGSASSPPMPKKCAVGSKFRATQAGSYSVHFRCYVHVFFWVFSQRWLICRGGPHKLR